MALHIDQRTINLLILLMETQCEPVNFLAKRLGEVPVINELPDGLLDVRYHWTRGRLADLASEGYAIELTDLRPRLGQKRRYYVYAITPKGRELVRGWQEAHNQPLTVSYMRLTSEPDHDLGSSLVMASIRLGIAEQGLRYITPHEFLHERLNSKGTLITPYETRISEAPFAIPVSYLHRKRPVTTMKKHDWHPFGISYGDNYLYFAGIEFDRNTEGKRSVNAERASIERHLRMIHALHDEGYKAHFGTRALRVPIVTTGPVERWIEVDMEITNGKGSEYILYQHMPDWCAKQFDCGFPPADGHRLTNDWQRAGHAPFNILDELKRERAAA